MMLTYRNGNRLSVNLYPSVIEVMEPLVRECNDLLYRVEIEMLKRKIAVAKMPTKRILVTKIVV